MNVDPNIFKPLNMRFALSEKETSYYNPLNSLLLGFINSQESSQKFAR